MSKRPSFKRWFRLSLFALLLLLLVALAVWRGDILRAALDPQVPFQTYTPPAAPDYAKSSAWALRNASTPGSGDASVFFLHSTTFDGGKEWNGPIGDAKADAYLEQIVLPNFAAPFAIAGNVSAPLYRQGSLYSRLTLREDAREARAFAYGDVEDAFEHWLALHPDGPIVLAGVEQGAELLARLLRDRVARDAALKERLVAAYMIDAMVPKDAIALPICSNREDSGCLLAWSMVDEGTTGVVSRRQRRALFWDDKGRLVESGDRPIICVNPVSGADDMLKTDPRRHLGAANAAGLEWGVRPAFIDRAVAAQCRDGFLRNTPLKSESFREQRAWTDRRKAKPYNLFYADIMADVQARLSAWHNKKDTAFRP
ncbi:MULTISPECIES: DUF3089 domain-containing protein [unclassified Brevundimonas]|uniref:DUF3089 domain-containing protein n=1 Tax=unclassified Brevundimonas TaxID=2622653 RepID=UPI0025C1EF80|nr:MULTISPECIES: DUF3089 domain-containing protein [unclassified Brevundimonas]